MNIDKKLANIAENTYLILAMTCQLHVNAVL